jgi:hypothetical protein
LDLRDKFKELSGSFFYDWKIAMQSILRAFRIQAVKMEKSGTVASEAKNIFGWPNGGWKVNSGSAIGAPPESGFL